MGKAIELLEKRVLTIKTMLERMRKSEEADEKPRVVHPHHEELKENLRSEVKELEDGISILKSAEALRIREESTKRIVENIEYFRNQHL